MLMDTFKVMVNNPFEEIFYGEKKKQLMFWQLFPFPIKVVSKLSWNGLLTIVLMASVSMTLYLYML